MPSTFPVEAKYIYGTPEHHDKAMCAPAEYLCRSCREFITSALGNPLPDPALGRKMISDDRLMLRDYVSNPSETPGTRVRYSMRGCELCGFLGKGMSYSGRQHLSYQRYVHYRESVFRSPYRRCATFRGRPALTHSILLLLSARRQRPDSE